MFNTCRSNMHKYTRKAHGIRVVLESVVNGVAFMREHFSPFVVVLIVFVLVDAFVLFAGEPE